MEAANQQDPIVGVPLPLTALQEVAHLAETADPSSPCWFGPHAPALAKEAMRTPCGVWVADPAAPAFHPEGFATVEDWQDGKCLQRALDYAHHHRNLADLEIWQGWIFFQDEDGWWIWDHSWLVSEWDIVIDPTFCRIGVPTDACYIGVPLDRALEIKMDTRERAAAV